MAGSPGVRAFPSPRGPPRRPLFRDHGPEQADTPRVASELAAVLRLEVPVIVRLGERTMTVGEVLGLVPGAIIELPKNAEAELDLLVNNKPIGSGIAVKIGENFGLRITRIGNVRTRIEAMGSAASPQTPPPNVPPDPGPAPSPAERTETGTDGPRD